ncbi:protein PSK SIMULATOR 1-like [Juglans microcarpa x Juglans regia]|uniref:protein PSK SIMULATOR 1-like n=1 Tax=Juglans microcarpa x Juglans regia TaxID=2249226 RepID=UPI001B7EE84B|nr:protein PSK SIMULATOR 1-like [Juglans microcarpa x Juglans regia]
MVACHIDTPYSKAWIALHCREKKDLANGFFESNSKLLKPSATMLGAGALALHYSNLIIVMEKMIKSPQLVGVDARDDLHAMLPSSIRSMLRDRLKGSTGFSASDLILAREWREALGRILGWFSPLAHNMIKWQSEKSFKHQTLVPKTNMMLLQTLFFVNKEKTRAAIIELLVGLNYIWKFEREMIGKGLFESTNFNGILNALTRRV